FVLSLAGMATVLIVAPLLGDAKALGWARAIGRDSLGVYATHLWIVVGLGALATAIPARGALEAWLPLAIAAGAVVIAYALARFLKRWAPVPFLKPWWDISARETAESQMAQRPAQ